MVHIFSIQPKQQRMNQITFAPSEAKTGAEMCPAIVCGNVTGNVPVTYWPIFFPCLSKNPRSLCESLLVPLSISIQK